VPTNDAVADAMLKAANVGPNDLVFDLGAGDGKIAIAAAKNYGARAVGIEYNKDMAALAARNAQRAGVSDKVKIIHGDIFVEDFSKATVLTMYLLPDLNLKLRPTILKMAPGTRVATNSFNMGDWEPDQVIGNGYAQGYFWVVPGNAAGKWTIKGINGGQGDVLELTQQYQKVGGTLTIKGKAQPILGGKLTGNRLKFSFVDEGGQSRHFDVELKGNTMQGNVLEMSPLYEVSGTRS
jgi:SAM-dependent methyltransferase